MKTDKEKHIKQPCAHPGCPHNGDFPAPLHPQNTQTIIWLCLEHVRLHNAHWDALRGFSEQDIEKVIRHATVWERPTWPRNRTAPTKNAAKERPRSSCPAKVTAAFATLDLSIDAPLSMVKKRYHFLAKRYHPDMNNGSKEALGLFHKIQEAFATIEKYYAKT